MKDNRPLTQVDLDKMDFDKVWISYGPEPDNGEWALVYNGQLYSIDTLEGAGFEDMLHDLVEGESLDNPSGAYRVYRFSLKELRNTLPESPLTIKQLLEMDRPVWCSCKPIEGRNGYWCLCKNGNIITPGGSIFNVKEIPHWVFYAHPHAQIDREEFCGAWEGEADGYADGELVYDVWRCSGCGHVEETDDPDLLPDFCPDCGLAMTEKAREIMEKRLRG